MPIPCCTEHSSLLTEIQTRSPLLARSEFLTAMLIKMQVLWDMTPPAVSERLPSFIFRACVCLLRTWRWRTKVRLKYRRRFTSNHGITFRKIWIIDFLFSTASWMFPIRVRPKNSALTSLVLYLVSKVRTVPSVGVHKPSKTINHLKFPGAGIMTWSKFHSEDSKILPATVWISPDCPEIVNSYSSTSFTNYCSWQVKKSI